MDTVGAMGDPFARGWARGGIVGAHMEGGPLASLWMSRVAKVPRACNHPQLLLDAVLHVSREIGALVPDYCFCNANIYQPSSAPDTVCCSIATQRCMGPKAQADLVSFWAYVCTAAHANAAVNLVMDDSLVEVGYSK